MGTLLSSCNLIIAAISRVFGSLDSSRGMATFFTTFLVVLEAEDSSVTVGYRSAWAMAISNGSAAAKGSSGNGTSSALALFFLGDLLVPFFFFFALLLTVTLSCKDSYSGDLKKSFETLGAEVVSNGSKFRLLVYFRMLRLAWARWLAYSSA